MQPLWALRGEEKRGRDRCREMLTTGARREESRDSGGSLNFDAEKHPHS